MDFFTSKCCKAEAIIQFSDLSDFLGDDPKRQKIGTAHFICEKCKKPCDILPLEKTILKHPSEENNFKLGD
jgi:Fe2+ or Zn2+ uptake regulation protein